MGSEVQRYRIRVVGSRHTGTIAGYDLLRMLGHDGNPTLLGAAFAEYGRVAKTLHLLAMCDPDDETYRRSVHVQLTVRESRHRLALKIFHGSRGEIHKRYREGQEDQLASLGPGPQRRRAVEHPLHRCCAHRSARAGPPGQ